MGRIYFPSIYDFGRDVPWDIRVLVWKKYILEREDTWFLVYRGTRRGTATLYRLFRSNGLMAATHRYSDGTTALYASIWRFDNEGT